MKEEEVVRYETVCKMRDHDNVVFDIPSSEETKDLGLVFEKSLKLFATIQDTDKINNRLTYDIVFWYPTSRTTFDSLRIYKRGRQKSFQI